MFVVLLQFPVDSEEKKIELDKLLNSSDGLAFTKKQKGFISVEYGWADDKKGYKTWWGWEKWSSKKEYETYLQGRKADNIFADKFFSITPDGPKPHEIGDVDSQ